MSSILYMNQASDYLVHFIMNQASDYLVHFMNQSSDFPVHQTSRFIPQKGPQPVVIYHRLGT